MSLFPLHIPSPHSFGLSASDVRELEHKRKTEEIKEQKKKNTRDFIIYKLLPVIYAIIMLILGFFLADKGMGFDTYTVIGKIISTVLLAISFGFSIIFAGGLILTGLLFVLQIIILPFSEIIEKSQRNKKSSAENISEKELKYRNYLQSLEKYVRECEIIKNKHPLLKEMNEREYAKIILESFVNNHLKESIKNEDIKKNKEWWYNLNPDEFEEEISRLYLKKGYKTHVTRYSNDGGVDVIAEINNERTYIQCKHYTSGLIPVNVVRELLGVMVSDNIKHGALACLNGGTTGCVEFAKKNNIKLLTIKDYTSDYKPQNIPKSINKSEIEYCMFYTYGRYLIWAELFNDIAGIEQRIHMLKFKFPVIKEYSYGVFLHQSAYIIAISEYENLTIAKPIKIYNST